MTSTWGSDVVATEKDAPGPLSTNDFLGGRLRIAQPVGGYRSGVDAVLLAAAAPARSGETLLELGCGAGVALLCAAARVPGLSVAGVEVQSAYAELARANAVSNRIAAEVFAADIAALPRALLERRFDHVIANPPYYAQGHGKPAHDEGRDRGRSGADLSIWIDCASRRLAPKGRLTLIQHIARLREILSGLPPSLGTVRVLPLAARSGREPERFLLQATKAGRGAFRLLSPLTLHENARHERDTPDYRPEIEQVLRNGAALPIGD